MQPILFVLGAGASHPFGFPIGSQLMQLIGTTLTKEAGTTFHNSIYNEFGTEKAKEVGNTITFSPLLSIDRLLANHSKDKDFVRIGKLSIAYMINRFEDDNRLFAKFHDDKTSDSWYSYLFNRIFDLCKNDPENIFNFPIYFVTYNYDRSLEQFLYKSLRYSFPISDARAKELTLKYLTERVHHVHGDLGSIFEVPYQNHDSNFSTTNKMAGNIRIVHEEDDNTFLENISSLIRKVRRVYFLGFGFGIDNLNKLWFPKDGNRNGQYKFSLCGSRYGIKLGEINDIKSYFSTKNMDIDFHENVSQIKTWDLDVYNYIRNFCDFT